MKFDPEKSMFIQEFGKLLDEMKKVFDDQKNEVQRVITHNDLMPLVTGLITESGPKFNTIVETSYKYHMVSNKIIAKLEEDFSALEESSKKWKDVREIFDASKSYNQEQFFANNRTVEPIRQQLQKFVDWQVKLKDCKQQEVKGMINMDARSMKGKLEKFLRESHMELRKHAFNIGNKEIAIDIFNKLSELKK